MKKRLIGLSITLNIVLLAAVLIAIVSAVKLRVHYVTEPLHARWVSQFELLPIQRADVVFLGDSITLGGAWHELLPEISVRNRGIGGDTTVGVLARLHQVVAGKPAAIFLLIGTNDLWMGVEVSTIVSNTQDIVSSIHANSPGTKVFVQSVLPRGAGYRDQVESLNKALKEALNGQAVWVDLYSRFLEMSDGSIRDDLSNDELHLLGEGYLLWRDTIREHIEGVVDSQ